MMRQSVITIIVFITIAVAGAFYHFDRIEKIKSAAIVSAKNQAASLYYAYVSEPHKKTALKQYLVNQSYGLKSIEHLDPYSSNYQGYSVWIAEVVTSSLLYGFDDYESTLEKVKPYYSDRGFQSLLKAINKGSLSKKHIENNSYVTSVVPRTALGLNWVLNKKQPQTSHLLFDFQVVVTFFNGAKEDHKIYSVTVILNQSNRDELKIEQIILVEKV